MEKVQELEKEYNKISDGDLDSIITFFECNSNELLSNEINDIEEIEHIYIDYLFALKNKSRYSKIIEVTKKLENIESVIKYSETDNDFKNDLIFYKAASLFCKRRYKEAKRGFATIVKLDPENEDFLEWYNTTKKRILFRYISFIMFGSIGLAFLTLVIPEYFPITIPKIYQRIFEGIFYVSLGFFLIEKFINKK